MVNKELNEQIGVHQAHLKVIREEMLEAPKENDEETRQALQQEKHRLYENVNKMRMASEGMTSDYNEEKWRMGELVRRIQEETHQDRERVEAECRKRIDEVNQRLQQGTNLAVLLSRQHYNRSNLQPTGGTP